MHRRSIVRLLIFSVVPLLAGSFFVARTMQSALPELRTVRATHVAMDSIVEVTIVADPGAPAAELFEQVFAEVDRIERLASFFDPQSEVSRLNRRPNALVEGVDPELVRLLARAVALSRLTSGAYDFTVGRLFHVWGFVDKDNRVPSAAEIERALTGVGFDSVDIVDSSRVRFGKAGSEVILGGIAKGYAVDRSLEIVRRSGVRGALVNIAGDLRAFGRKADGSSWRVGIRHPRRQSSLLGVLEVQDRAVATSGDYERYFEVDGVRFHHLMDPNTGWPATGCQSVTIVAESAELADALATAVFVMGPERGMEFIERTEGVEGLIVSKGGTITASSGLNAFGFQAVW